jgi:hypothetical protein
MECPSCSRTVRTAGDVPPSLAGTYGYVRCPQPECARELVIAIATLDDDAESRLLDARSARREARLVAEPRPVLVATVSVAMALLTGAALWACGDRVGFVFTVVLTALGAIAMIVAPPIIDELVGAWLWMKRLPRVRVALGAPAEAYRR